MTENNNTELGKMNDLRSSLSAFAPGILLSLVGLFFLLVPVTSGKLAMYADDHYVSLVENMPTKYVTDVTDNMIPMVITNKYVGRYNLEKDSLKQVQVSLRAQADSLYRSKKREEARELEIQVKQIDTLITQKFNDMQIEKESLGEKDLEEIGNAIMDTLPMEKYYADLVSKKLEKNYSYEDFTFKKAQQQDSTPFILAGFSLIIVGLSYLLFKTNKLPLNQKGLAIGVSALFLCLSAYTMSLMMGGIKKSVDFNEISRQRELKVRAQLVLIRDIQKQYKKYNNKFAGSFDELSKWLKSDSVEQKKKIQINDSTTEEILTKVPAMEAVLPVDKYPTFDVTSLGNIPHTENMSFEMKAGKVNRNGVDVPVFEVSTLMINFLEDIALENFDKAKVIKVGDMTKPSYNGNWGE